MSYFQKNNLTEGKKINNFLFAPIHNEILHLMTFFILRNRQIVIFYVINVVSPV